MLSSCKMNRSDKCRLAGLVMVVIMLLMGAQRSFAQSIALKTNALYWATTTFNAGAEIRVAPKWTVGLTAGYNPFTYSDNTKLKHVLIEPEARYWLCSPYAGHFIGANAIYSHYNVGNIDVPFGIFPELDDHRFQGDLGAIGLVYGYSWMLGRRWSIEAAIGLGIGVTHYKKYMCEVCGSQVDDHTRWLFMPTKLAISAIYYIR